MLYMRMPTDTRKGTRYMNRSVRKKPTVGCYHPYVTATYLYRITWISGLKMI